MMDPELPSGDFTIVSVVNPDDKPQAQSKPQKRTRGRFICTPCHRRRLKCDKHQPCTRCIDSGYPSDCVYERRTDGTGGKPSTESREFNQSSPQPSSQPSSSPSPQPGFVSIISKDSARLNGVTHWSTIAFEVRTLGDRVLHPTSRIFMG